MFKSLIKDNLDSMKTNKDSFLELNEYKSKESEHLNSFNDKCYLFKENENNWYFDPTNENKIIVQDGNFDLQETFKIICSNKKVTELCLENNDLSGENSWFLIAILNSSKRILKESQVLCSIKKLNLTNTGLGLQNLNLLKSFIDTSKTLKVLNLSNNFLEKGIYTLLDSALCSKSIEVLDLSCNSVKLKNKFSFSDNESAIKKKKILEVKNIKKSLSHTLLNGSEFDLNNSLLNKVDNEAEIIERKKEAENVNNDNESEEIHLLGKKISNVSLKNDFNVKSEERKQTSLLKMINLSYNFVEINEISSFMSKLKFCSELVELNLSNCDMYDLMYEPISAYIAKCSSLKILDLSYNNPTIKGIRMICNSLLENESLSILNLTGSISHSSINEINMIKRLRSELTILYTEFDDYFKNDSNNLHSKNLTNSVVSIKQKTTKNLNNFTIDEDYFN